MKRLITGIAAALAAVLMIATPVLAIALPDSTPTITVRYAWRNVIETGDFLLIFEENTPYAATPTTVYSEAFIWRLIDTDGTTELGQAQGYNYFESGYGYNVISFYFSAADAPTWAQIYHLRLSGTPTAFTTPPSYNFDLTSSDYSSLTATADVKADIAVKIITLAQDLENRWSLSTANALVTQEEGGSYLSVLGQAFFRGAILGIQAMAPTAFPATITNVDTSQRTFGTTYSSNLAAQNAGTYVATGLQAGEDFLDVGWNMMGMLIIFGIGFGLLFAHWRLAGGELWRGFVEFAAPLVIGMRLGLIGAGEVALVVALCWLFSSAKIWRVI